MAELRMCQITIKHVPCLEPAESFWEGGCAHEHVTTDVGICAEHRYIPERKQLCVPCRPDHECEVRLREVTPAASGGSDWDD